MLRYSRFLLYFLSALLGGLTAPLHAAETGVSDQEIVLGQSLGITGPLAQMAPDIANGAKAYFRTVVLDDGYDPATTQKTVHQLIDEDKVFALYSLTGTANVVGVLPLLAKASSPVPMFAPFTGADAVRTPQKRLR